MREHLSTTLPQQLFMEVNHGRDSLMPIIPHTAFHILHLAYCKQIPNSFQLWHTWLLCLIHYQVQKFTLPDLRLIELRLQAYRFNNVSRKKQEESNKLVSLGNLLFSFYVSLSLSVCLSLFLSLSLPLLKVFHVTHSVDLLILRGQMGQLTQVLTKLLPSLLTVVTKKLLPSVFAGSHSELSLPAPLLLQSLVISL
jgi:hypothetical protein